MKKIKTKEIELYNCSGYKTTGYWKGYKCGAIAKYKFKNKWYCKNHLPVESLLCQKQK